LHSEKRVANELVEEIKDPCRKESKGDEENLAQKGSWEDGRKHLRCLKIYGRN